MLLIKCRALCAWIVFFVLILISANSGVFASRLGGLSEVAERVKASRLSIAANGAKSVTECYPVLCYGANFSSKRLRDRVGEPVLVLPARAEQKLNFSIPFQKQDTEGRWYTGISANILDRGRELPVLPASGKLPEVRFPEVESPLFGTVAYLRRDQLNQLDQFEGAAPGAIRDQFQKSYGNGGLYNMSTDEFTAFLRSNYGYRHHVIPVTVYEEGKASVIPVIAYRRVFENADDTSYDLIRRAQRTVAERPDIGSADALVASAYRDLITDGVDEFFLSADARKTLPADVVGEAERYRAHLMELPVRKVESYRAEDTVKSSGVASGSGKGYLDSEAKVSTVKE